MAYSQSALAKKLGVSKQYISKAEQGTYTSLNPSLIRWVSSALNLSPTAVSRRYEHFQVEARKSTLAEIAPHALVRSQNNNDPGHVLFEQWLLGYWPSHIAFSQGLCVHPEMVRKYVEGITPEMPKQIKTILTDAGLMEANWREMNQKHLARLETF